MSNNKSREDEFASILKQHGLETPSEQFAENLSRMVALKRQRYRPAVFKSRNWVGKCIITLLVLFNLLFLYYLNPFSIQPVITISGLAFLIGFWLLISLMMKRKSEFSV